VLLVEAALINCFRMDNIRPEVEKFMSACERLFGFTHESGRLTHDECVVLEYYAQELHKQITPLCTDSQDQVSASR
jgi:hypothetical protein